MRKSDHGRAPVLSASFDGPAGLSPGNMPALTGLGQIYVRSVARWHEEMSRFLSERFGKDAKAIHAACACKDVSAFLSVQQKWANEMIGDYLEQSTRLASVAAEAGEAAVGTVVPELRDGGERSRSLHQAESTSRIHGGSNM